MLTGPFAFPSTNFVNFKACSAVIVLGALTLSSCVSSLTTFERSTKLLDPSFNAANSLLDARIFDSLASFCALAARSLSSPASMKWCGSAISSSPRPITTKYPARCSQIVLRLSHASLRALQSDMAGTSSPFSSGSMHGPLGLNLRSGMQTSPATPTKTKTTPTISNQSQAVSDVKNLSIRSLSGAGREPETPEGRRQPAHPTKGIGGS